MENEIKYIGFYNLPDLKDKRYIALAATNKMDYICQSINKAGFKVHLVSPAWFNDKINIANFKWQSTVQINENNRLTLCPSFGTKSKILTFLKILLSISWLFFWLVLNIKRNEKILVYHSPFLSLPIRFARTLIGFKIILEVEEIYKNVKSSGIFYNKEEDKLIKSANSFLFSSDLLPQKFNSGKPYSIIYGVYSIFPQLVKPDEDGIIHLVYAGIIDQHKAGAFNAIESTRFLNKHYMLHVIGFGKTDDLIERISELNITNECKIVFDGQKSGEEYIEYCQKCSIGLSTQNVEGIYLETSFPSKILSYLCLGLSVVSGNIECVTKSQIGDLVFYYNENTPESIAKAILEADLNKSSINRERIKQLDENFVRDLRFLVVN